MLVGGLPTGGSLASLMAPWFQARPFLIAVETKAFIWSSISSAGDARLLLDECRLFQFWAAAVVRGGVLGPLVPGPLPEGESLALLLAPSLQARAFAMTVDTKDCIALPTSSSGATGLCGPRSRLSALTALSLLPEMQGRGGKSSCWLRASVPNDFALPPPEEAEAAACRGGSLQVALSGDDACAAGTCLGAAA